MVQEPRKSHRLGSALWVIFAILTLSSVAFPQKPEPLEITGEVLTKTVYGGENLIYSFTVTNRSDKTAKNVYLSHELDGLFAFVSASVSQGTYKSRFEGWTERDRRILAEFGDLPGNTGATLTIEVKIQDWDLVENTSDECASVLLNRMRLQSRVQGERENIAPKASLPPGARLLTIEFPHISCDECVRPEGGLGQPLEAITFPSKNRPPSVRILLPKDDVQVVRKVRKPTDVTLQIRATDPDGSVTKVHVHDPEADILAAMIVENGVRKIKIGGNALTVEEIEENPNLWKYFERLAVPFDQGMFTYTLKNLAFGFHNVGVTAFDDGGRTDGASVGINVVGDASIDFEFPKESKVLRPASKIVIRTVSTINDPDLKELRIVGTDPATDFGPREAIPLMTRTSVTGNVQHHQYTWKNVEEGVYLLRLLLLSDDENAFSARDKSIRVIVAAKRVIKIFSLKNGQEFSEGDPVKVSIDIRDIKGRKVDDQLELWIDGKKYSDISSSWTYDPVGQKPVIDPEFGSSITRLEKGTHTLQVIAKYFEVGMGSDSPETGRSSPITIRIK